MNLECTENSVSSDLAAPSRVARRDFIRTAAFAGAAVFLGASSDANAFWFLKPRQTDAELFAELDIPDEWAARFGDSLPGYVRYLRDLRLRKISVKSIIAPQFKQRGPVANRLPPKALWRNLTPTLRAVDRLCVVMNEPVEEVISAYRTPEYNRRCGSSNSSQHVRNTALDLRFKSSPGEVSKVARELRDKGLFEGGVGRYRGFTHIDTRGRNADW